MPEETKEEIEESRNKWKGWGIFSILYFIFSLLIIAVIIIYLFMHNKTFKGLVDCICNKQLPQTSTQISPQISPQTPSQKGGCGCSSISGGCNCVKGGAKNSSNFLKSLM